LTDKLLKELLRVLGPCLKAQAYPGV
jgi:hypothetical protein